MYKLAKVHAGSGTHRLRYQLADVAGLNTGRLRNELAQVNTVIVQNCEGFNMYILLSFNFSRSTET